jgi:hypothetical protein
MLGMSLKDFAGWAGLFIGAVIAAVLGFAPIIVDKQIATWPTLVWITFALTLMTVVCFGIERRESSKADEKRDQYLLSRDANVQKIADQFETFQKQQEKFSELQEQNIREAKKLYAAIAKMTSQSPGLAASIAKGALETGLTALMKLPGGGSFPLDFLKDWLKNTWKWRTTEKKRETIEDMRRVADSLMLSAFGVPAEELDLPSPGKRPPVSQSRNSSDESAPP